MIEEIGTKEILYGNRGYIYKVYLKQSYVYMCIYESNYCNDERYVVIVDSEKFCKEWIGNTVDQCVIADEYEQKKYDDAKRCFSIGIENPVPLAEAACHYGFSFIGGITRTKFLIRNGAKCFPIEFDKNSAMNICQNFPKILYSKKVENVYNLINQIVQ